MHIFFLLILSTVLFSCTNISLHQQQKIYEDPIIEPPSKNWWYARFLINWPDKSLPHWHIDVLLADTVIRPVLNQNRKNIKLWRFHRRAGRQWGHIFSFIFYAEPEIANEVYKEIKQNNIVTDLLADGVVEKFITDDLTQLKKPKIEDTSDQHWNEIIQKSWPYYIMGASEMWLDMIDLLVVYNQDKQEPIMEKYLHIQAAISKLWEQEGGHAFLHHLNALFAYQPVAITERRLMNY